VSAPVLAAVFGSASGLDRSWQRLAAGRYWGRPPVAVMCPKSGQPWSSGR